MRKSLGKGLDVLIPIRESEVVNFIPLDSIKPNPHQPRVKFDQQSLKQLSESIKEKGVLQPILVTPKDSGYEIIVGERRWRAAKIAGLSTIPAIIKKAEEIEKHILSLIENLQREDLSPLEEAQAYRELISKFSFTQEKLSSHLGMSRSEIANKLRLLNLPAKIKEKLEKKEISEGHARAILSLPPQKQEKVLNEIIIRHLNVRETEELIRKIEGKKQVKKEKSVYSELINKLEGSLGTKVEIIQTSATKGYIKIHYYSEQDLHRLYKHLLKKG